MGCEKDERRDESFCCFPVVFVVCVMMDGVALEAGGFNELKGDSGMLGEEGISWGGWVRHHTRGAKMVREKEREGG